MGRWAALINPSLVPMSGFLLCLEYGRPALWCGMSMPWLVELLLWAVWLVPHAAPRTHLFFTCVVKTQFSLSLPLGGMCGPFPCGPHIACGKRWPPAFASLAAPAMAIGCALASGWSLVATLVFVCMCVCLQFMCAGAVGVVHVAPSQVVLGCDL